MKKKLLSVLLVICMVLTLMPMAALADFGDTEGHWGKASIDRWAAAGVLNGKGEDSFDPNGNMTRAEFAQMLCNLMGYTKKAENTFTDIPDDAWYADAMLKLVEAGVITGVGDNMAAPNSPITREMAAVMLCRALNIPTSTADMGFSDAETVSSWASGAVAALTEKGMLNGVGENKVAPQLNINRASVATLVDNMVTEYVTEGEHTVTGKVKGIILVAGNAKVTFEGATGDASVFVAPSAEGASVTVDKDSDIESVTVAAEKAEAKVEGAVSTVTAAAEGAKVEVAKDATVEAVVVAAEKAEAKIEGAVGTVTVAEDAANSNVTVGKDATVESVAVEAEGTKVEVNGTVKDVTVAESANKTEITANEGAKIESVTTAAEDVKVDGKGEVSTVTATAGSANVTTPGTETKTEGDATVTDKPEEQKPTVGGGSSSNAPENPNARVGRAVFHDTRAEAEDAEEGKTYVPDATLKQGYSVSSDIVDGVTEVTIKHKNIWQHQNGATPEAIGYWTGFAITAPDGATGLKRAYCETKVDSPTLEEKLMEEIDAKGTKGFAIYLDVSNNAVMQKKYVAIEWTYPEGDTSREASEVEWYNIKTDVSMMPAVTNAETYIVNTKGDIVNLELPEDSYDALLGEDTTTWKNDHPLPEAPWLLVVYDRNVAAEGGLTLTVTKNGANLEASKADTATSLATIGTKRVQAWAFNPDNPTDSKTLKFDEDEIKSGTYGVNFGATGVNVDAKTVVYKAANETIYTVKFSGAKVPDQIVEENAKVNAPAEPTKNGWVFDNWYKDSEYEEVFYFDSETISENTTIFARFVEIVKTFGSVRPAGDPDNTDYAAIYKAAGLSYTRGTLSADQAKVLVYVSDADNTTKVAGITQHSDSLEADALYVGVAVAGPADAEKALVTAGDDDAAEIDVPSVDEKGHDIYKKGDDVYYIEYYPVICADGGAVGANDWTTTIVWKDEDGKILQADKLTVSRAATAEPVSLTVDTNKNADGEDDIREDGGEKYICFSLKNGSALFPVQTGKIVAAAEVGEDGTVTKKALWTTGDEGHTADTNELELPAASLKPTDEDYNHHVGMTFKMGDNEETVTWLFVTKSGNSYTVYSAEFEIPAKDGADVDAT